ncbi:MAG: hypothetical protein K1X57_04970 [Gemmataceae bacterium]|nr:hypothetical protein [Gemmataceae bacterium]
MKKLLSISLIAAFLAVISVGCGGSEPAKKPNPAPEKSTRENPPGK